MKIELKRLHYFQKFDKLYKNKTELSKSKFKGDTGNGKTNNNDL